MELVNMRNIDFPTVATSLPASGYSEMLFTNKRSGNIYYVKGSLGLIRTTFRDNVNIEYLLFEGITRSAVG